MSVSLLRLPGGEIALFYLRKNSLDDCRLYLRLSTDEGKTWGDPTIVHPRRAYFVVNNDRVIQLRSGRLVGPAPPATTSPAAMGGTGRGRLLPLGRRRQDLAQA